MLDRYNPFPFKTDVLRPSSPDLSRAPKERMPPGTGLRQDSDDGSDDFALDPVQAIFGVMRIPEELQPSVKEGMLELYDRLPKKSLKGWPTDWDLYKAITRIDLGDPMRTFSELYKRVGEKTPELPDLALDISKERVGESSYLVEPVQRALCIFSDAALESGRRGTEGLIAYV
ncbi:MAG: hypothetical protein JW727_05840 [Candidatus Aenigmarchaeota archaeon]|nr:hypothetical protein [Candidatus Aenigmarchaeota archaeon]